MSENRKRRLTQTTSHGVYNGKRSKNDTDCSPTPVSNEIKRRAGVVLRIVLKDFMCHSHLEVNFNSNINYIVGRNGSGKSAILTALVVGLGGRAKFTNRGSNIKGFVKTGKNSGTVEIVLNNTRPIGYRHSTYGNEIIVQRHFTASGSSSYKLKSSAGVVVSTSAKELKQILEYLNIQVDNPICILNQDTSRNFLCTSDVKQKFLLFMKATRLETLLEEHTKAHDNKIKCIREYEDKKQAHNQLAKIVNDLQRKVENHKEIANHRQKLKLLQNELLWSKVLDSEEELKKYTITVENFQNKYKTYEDNSKNRSQKLENINQRVSELQRQILELKDSVEVENQPQLDIQNQINGMKQAYSEKRRTKQQIIKQIEDKNKNIEILNNEITNFTARLGKIEQEKLLKRREMKDLEQKIKDIENAMETTQNDVFQLKNNISRQSERVNDLQTERTEIKKQHNTTLDRISSLKNKSNDSLFLYGKEMPQIMKAIQQNKPRFTQLPRGPLGSLINIKDKKWAIAIEGFLGASVLYSFTVDNKKDNAILMEIFNKYCPSRKPTVIISKFFNEVHNITSNLVQSDNDCISLYEAIDVKDPVVANCLIDNQSIEGILLIPSTERAIELLSNQSKVPRNCTQGITIKGDKYYPDPNYKTYASRYHKARFLQVNTEELLKGDEETLRDLTNQLKNIESQINTVTIEKSKQEAELNQLSNKFKKLKQGNVMAKRKLEELRLVEEPESVNIQSLENEMSELKEAVEQLKVNSGNIDHEMNTIKEDIVDAERKLSEVAKVVKSFEDRITPLERQIMEQDKNKKELDVTATFEKKRLQEVKNRLDIARSEMLSKQKEVKKLADEASAECERIEQVRKVPDVAAEIKNIESMIRKIENSVENYEEIRRKYEQVYRNYEDVTKFVSTLNIAIESFEVAVMKRRKQYKYTEEHFVTYIKHSFSNILHFRQFKGSVEINMTEKKLNLIVEPQQGTQGPTVTANLSGGERSFSTIAFLYALWQCTDLPFYFLDEFDVYMDKINRRKVMEILIHHAKAKPELEFVFLTPQDVSFTEDKDVLIYRLDDPERKTVPEA